MEILFNKNENLLNEQPRRKAIDQFLINVLDVKQPENIAGYLVYFKPIAGDYTGTLHSILIVDGIWQGILSYTDASRNEQFEKFIQKEKK